MTQIPADANQVIDQLSQQIGTLNKQNAILSSQLAAAMKLIRRMCSTVSTRRIMQRINWFPDPNITGTAPIGVANAKVDYPIVNGRKWMRATSTGTGDAHADYALTGSQLPPAARTTCTPMPTRRRPKPSSFSPPVLTAHINNNSPCRSQRPDRHGGPDHHHSVRLRSADRPHRS